FAKGSTTDVTMWMTRKTPTSNERLRCKDWTTNLGQSLRASRDDERTPSTRLALSRTSAVYPLARVAYHIGVGPASAASIGRGRSGSAGDGYGCSTVPVLGRQDRRAESGLGDAAAIGEARLRRRRGRDRVTGEAGGGHEREDAGERRCADRRVHGDPARASQTEVSPQAGGIKVGLFRHVEQANRTSLA